MDIFRALLLSMIPVFTASCANFQTRHPAKAALIGAWHGNSLGIDSGQAGDNLVVRNADGTFVSYFRLCDEHARISTVMVETGRWEYAEGVETTDTLTVNGAAVAANGDYYQEHYRVELLANDVLKLTSLKAYANAHPEFLETRIGTSPFHLPVEPCSGAARTATK